MNQQEARVHRDNGAASLFPMDRLFFRNDLTDNPNRQITDGRMHFLVKGDRPTDGPSYRLERTHLKKVEKGETHPQNLRNVQTAQRTEN